ncbi:MAG TPA: hypothetical protein VJ508_05965, partial [Saprospiraceae bacterium]|nr:hypothetical protein [Saprospiraceae bacterium]
MLRLIIIVVIVFGILLDSTISAQQRDTLLRFEADPTQGYNFPYYIYIPAGCNPLFEVTMLVEPNNTGMPNDTFQVHEKAAEIQARFGPLGNSISRTLHLPLLVPVFPRDQKHWKIYTHMLDRDVMRIKKGPLKRLDLQLLEMINAAREVLFRLGYRTTQKILMCGYSSSGVFANRFACLHPETIKAYSAGGIKGLLMMPFSRMENEKLK